ncbi:MAG TPA: ABC transporter permease [Gemmatimonadaceae bacterium]|nr:ABC transporter permease [Gemmatimonadaceae bacterium]
MSWLLALGRRVRYLVLRDRLTAELEEEMRAHVDMRVERLREAGASDGDARREARRRFGNRTALTERSRDAWGAGWIEQATADVRFAVRRLRRRPGFSVAAITVAALGIGASTAVFSAVDAALIRPLPFARPEQLVQLTDVSIPFAPDEDVPRPGPHFLDLDDAAAMHELFTSVAAYAAGGLNLVDANRPMRVSVGVVTPNLFATLGVRAQAGRVFASEEGRPNGAPVAVLSDAFWRTQFGGANVIGRSIDLSGTWYRVVGVMEPGFNFPHESDLWIPLTNPLTFAMFTPFHGSVPSSVVARLAAGVTPAEASARLTDQWVRLGGPHGPGDYFGDELRALRSTGAVIPLRRVLVGQNRRALLILLAATMLLLLVATLNVANLLLSDGASRRREIALREVLGATRGRLVRQLLVESVLLAACGAAIGLALAPVLLDVLRAMMPPNLAGIAPAELDHRVLAFAAVLAVVTGVLFGSWPAIAAAREDPQESLKAGGSLGATRGRLGVARRTLVTIEVALSVMLLVGSGLMLRSLHRLMSQTLDMNPDRVGTVEVTFRSDLPWQARSERLHAILDRVTATPGVQSAGAINDLPLGHVQGISLSISIDGAPRATNVHDMKYTRYLMASRGYFDALGIPMLRGHGFDASVSFNSPKVAVINESMARTYWPNIDPIGRTFHLVVDQPAVTVIGVVGDVHDRSLADTVAPQMYLPIEQQPPDHAAIVARGALLPSVLLSRLVDAVHAADPAQAVYNVRTMDDVVSASVAPRRTNTVLIAIFAAVALALSAFGLYAVVSYSVTQRSREFGIRAALGATGAQLARLVGREMMVVVALGAALGLAGAWAAARVMESLLFGISAHDVATFAAVPLVLLVPTVLATLIPARRAMRANPMDVIRTD